MSTYPAAALVPFRHHDTAAPPPPPASSPPTLKAWASPACPSGVAAYPPTDAAQSCKRSQGVHTGQQEGAQALSAVAEQDPHPLLLLLALLLLPIPLLS
jgi:hypothetical protein